MPRVQRRLRDRQFAALAAVVDGAVFFLPRTGRYVAAGAGARESTVTTDHGLSDFDTPAVMDAVQAVRAGENESCDLTAAVCFIHRHAETDADELRLLRALGLAPDVSARRVRVSQTAGYRQAKRADAAG